MPADVRDDKGVTPGDGRHVTSVSENHLVLLADVTPARARVVESWRAKLVPEIPIVTCVVPELVGHAFSSEGLFCPPFRRFAVHILDR